MHRATKVTLGGGYTLFVEFEDGIKGTVDLSSRLFGAMFEPLRDRSTFEQVAIDEYGAVCWPNGADLAPDALYSVIAAQQRPEPALA